MKNYLEAEITVIGSILIEPSLLKKAKSLIKPEMFSNDDLKTIFSIMLDMDKNKKPVDAGSVAINLDMLYREFIKKCIDATPSTVNFEYYMNELYEGWRERKIIEKLQELTISGMSADELTAEIIKVINEQHELIAKKHNSAEKNFMDAVADLWVRLFEEDTSLKTRWPEFNRILGGFQRGGVYVLAARPGDGKSDFAIMLAAHLSMNYAVDFLSLEMSVEQLTQRIISRACKINSSKLVEKKVDEEEQRSIGYVVDKMKNLRLVMDDTSPITVDDIEKRLSTRRPDMIVIDYLSLIKMDTSRGKQQWQAIGETTHALKALARKYNCVILLLAQLNRAVDKKNGISLSDLRGGTDIEADADGVFFLRPQKTEGFLSGDDFWEVDFIIAKNRHGCTGKVQYNWWPHYHDYKMVTNIYE